MSDMIWNGSYTLGNSQETQITAGTGIKVTTPAAGQIQISNDETVLWENNRAWVATDVAPEVNSGTLSEAITNFKTIKIYFARTNDTSLHYNSVSEMESSDISSQGGFFISTPILQSPSKNLFLACTFISVSGTTFTESIGTQWSQASGNADSSKIFLHPYKIVGIDRISGGN